jgi:hypothetical protein
MNSKLWVCLLCSKRSADRNLATDANRAIPNQLTDAKSLEARPGGLVREEQSPASSPKVANQGHEDYVLELLLGDEQGRSMHWTSESEQLAAATMNHTMVEKAARSGLHNQTP